MAGPEPHHHVALDLYWTNCTQEFQRNLTDLCKQTLQICFCKKDPLHQHAVHSLQDPKKVLREFAALSWDSDRDFIEAFSEVPLESPEG